MLHYIQVPYAIQTYFTDNMGADEHPVIVLSRQVFCFLSMTALVDLFILTSCKVQYSLQLLVVLDITQAEGKNNLKIKEKQNNQLACLILIHIEDLQVTFVHE